MMNSTKSKSEANKCIWNWNLQTIKMLWNRENMGQIYMVSLRSFVLFGFNPISGWNLVKENKSQETKQRLSHWHRVSDLRVSHIPIVRWIIFAKKAKFIITAKMIFIRPHAKDCRTQWYTVHSISWIAHRILVICINNRRIDFTKSVFLALNVDVDVFTLTNKTIRMRWGSELCDNVNNIARPLPSSSVIIGFIFKL